MEAVEEGVRWWCLTWPMQLTLGEEGSSFLGQRVLGRCAIVSFTETLHSIGRNVLLAEDEEAAGFPFL